MASQSRESKLERDIRRYAEATGWWQAKFVSPSKDGVPDRVFIRDGIVLWMEIKRPDAKPRQKQNLRITEMKKYGAIVCWVDNFADAKEWLDLL